MIRILPLLAGLCLVLFVVPLAAREPDAGESLHTPAAISEYHVALREQLQTAPKYKHLDERTRAAIYAAQDDVQRLAEEQAAAGRDGIDDGLRAAHEKVVELVLDSDLDRPICQRERRTGSRLGQVACRSKREADEQRDAARNALGKTRGCLGNACGPPK